MEKKEKYSTKRFVLSIVAIAVLFCVLMCFFWTALGLLAIVVVGGTVALIMFNGGEGTLQLTYEDCPGGLLVTGTTVFETRRIVIPSEVDGVPVIGIDEGAFEDNDKLIEIVFPDTLKSIESNAFYGCDSLSKVNLPDSLEYIGDEAFFGCTELKEVTLGKSTRYIGNGAFSDCVMLEKIDLLNVEEIGMQAFYSCESLAEVIITETVDKIGMGAFFGCSSIERLEIYGGEFLAGGKYVVTAEELSMTAHMINLLTDSLSQYDWERG